MSVATVLSHFIWIGFSTWLALGLWRQTMDPFHDKLSFSWRCMHAFALLIQVASVIGHSIGIAWWLS